MCGIFGYTGNKNCVDLIFEGLCKLEYRGYDSSGIAIINTKDSIELVKSKGKLFNLKDKLTDLDQKSITGIGHTRWATHGKVNDINAHPHINNLFAVVHNGIIENFKEIKKYLISKKFEFKTETDTEVVLNLLQYHFDIYNDLKKAILETTNKLIGSFAIGIINKIEPKTVFIIKKYSPVVIAVTENAYLFASDVTALDKYNKIIFLEDDNIAILNPFKMEVLDFKGKKIKYKTQNLNLFQNASSKQGFKHYMLKEINEQAATISNLIKNWIDFEKNQIIDKYNLLNNVNFNQIDLISIIACGTSYHAGLIGKYILQEVLNIPIQVETSSEYRYMKKYHNKNQIIISISQSGETADTLAAIKEAKKFGSKIISICNVYHSSITRYSDINFYMETGPEISVASTKTFTAAVIIQYFMSLLFKENIKNVLDDLKKIPSYINHVLNLYKKIIEISKKFFNSNNFLFIGRGIGYPLALEGALKLKEISYIHAQGYPGGELKHGPIALIDENMPVMCILLDDKNYYKMLSNIEEVKSRGGKIIIITENQSLESKDMDIIHIPYLENSGLKSILFSICLQLFAYQIASLKGSDIDQPRNLAKSVTVE